MSDTGCTVVDDRITKRLLHAVDGADPRADSQTVVGFSLLPVSTKTRR